MLLTAQFSHKTSKVYLSMAVYLTYLMTCKARLDLILAVIIGDEHFFIEMQTVSKHCIGIQS